MFLLQGSRPKALGVEALAGFSPLIIHREGRAVGRRWGESSDLERVSGRPGGDDQGPALPLSGPGSPRRAPGAGGRGLSQPSHSRPGNLPQGQGRSGARLAIQRVYSAVAPSHSFPKGRQRGGSRRHLGTKLPDAGPSVGRGGPVASAAHCLP